MTIRWYMQHVSLGRRQVVMLGIGWLLFSCSGQQETPPQADGAGSDSATVATDSVDQSTGLTLDENLPLVVANCTACHSSKLITQNRATRDGWKSMIVWMQETQNLWDLGPNEDKILDYLSTYYAPQETGRRKNLTDIEWYDLEEK